MKVKLLFLFTSMLFINICFSQVTEDTLNKALNGFKTDCDAKFGVFKIVQYSGLSRWGYLVKYYLWFVP